MIKRKPFEPVKPLNLLSFFSRKRDMSSNGPGLVPLAYQKFSPFPGSVNNRKTVK